VTVLAAQNVIGKDDWQTPAVVLDRVRQVAPIALDPCTTRANPTGALVTCVERVSMREACIVDGLAQDWCALLAITRTPGLVFANPPYSRGSLDPWTAKCRAEAKRGAEVIALVPVDTSTVWWQDNIVDATVCFWRGRLRFVGADGPAPFASAICYWGRRATTFRRAFRDAGTIWNP
jgi:phage N-6-adenine-methyltransferase